MKAALAFLTLAMLAMVAPAHAAPANSLQVLDRDDRFDTSLLRIDEAAHLGGTVPDVSVITLAGQHSLYELIGAKPTILLLAYYSCGHSCPVTIRGLAGVDIAARTDDYQVLVLSFDPEDSQAAMKGVRSSLESVPPNWTFGILPDGANRQLTDAVGYKYFFSERDQLYVHPAVLVFLSPEGRVMRYLYGAEPQADDVELALIESRGRAPRLNELVDMVKLTCFQFDQSRSRYVLHPTVIFGGAGFALLGLVGLATLASKKTSRGVQ